MKDDVGGWKERSREGVKNKEWEADTGVNPLSGVVDFNLSFLWKC